MYNENQPHTLREGSHVFYALSDLLSKTKRSFKDIFKKWAIRKRILIN
jgi:hypothetical protein